MSVRETHNEPPDFQPSRSARPKRPAERSRRRVAGFAGLALAAAVFAAPTASASPNPHPHKPSSAPQATAVGWGGAVASESPDATRVGLQVLAKGGNAVDAAVAVAATLGVAEPFSAGIGGGGFFLFYDAKNKTVHTIDGRETAPAAMQSDAFAPSGVPLDFSEAVTSGLSVGVPGTLATWQAALEQYGTITLRAALAGATQVAERGFVVDQNFHNQVVENQERFAAFPATAKLFLPNGNAPEVGSKFKNHDLAMTYKLIARQGTKAFYTGPIGADLVATVQNPAVADGVSRVVRPGLMTTEDLGAYRAVDRAPTMVSYRGLDVYGMAPPSSGGSTVGEALNILENVKLSEVGSVQAMHHYLEASALAFADRNRYVGDADQVDVPLKTILSQSFADSRACLIKNDRVLARPVAPGMLDGSSSCAPGSTGVASDHEGKSTTHLSVADKWGNLVAYTVTIEQTGGSGMVVPGRGFLLNNELTDFNFVDGQNGHDPNLPAPGKRPRSSMSPTIVLQDSKPFLVLGSPGGSTIITTVLQTLINRVDLGMTLPEAVAAARATQRNTATTLAEPGFDRSGLTELGHVFGNTASIGSVNAIEILGQGKMLAAAEPIRRGGGTAAVVRPAKH